MAGRTGPTLGARRRPVGLRAVLVVGVLAATVLSGPLAASASSALVPLDDKAAAYDTWHTAFHSPGFGSEVELLTTTADSFDIVGYVGRRDSVIGTGEYLASQAFRYAATGDPQAKANTLQAAQAFHLDLEVTDHTAPAEVAPGREGTALIARFAGPYTPLFTAQSVPWAPIDCQPADVDCHVITDGPHAGSYWLGDTSRDAYTGWFFGYAVAYDLVDDAAMRAMIADDVRRVILQLRVDGYVIRDRDGKATTTSDIGYSMRLAWHLIAAHVTGDPELERIYEREAPGWMVMNALTTFHEYNLYREYFAFNLAHMVYYSLLSLETDHARRSSLAGIFRTRIQRLVAHTHNVFFDYVAAAVLGVADEAVLEDDRVSLGLFRDAPNRHTLVELPVVPADPFADRLYRLSLRLRRWQPDFPILIRPRTLSPRPVNERCPSGFVWSKTPYPVECGEENLPDYGRRVYPGTDYLLAYWMGRHHGFLTAAD